MSTPSEQRTKEQLRHDIMVDFHLATALVTARQRRLQEAQDALEQLVQAAMARLSDWPDLQAELRQMLQPAGDRCKE